MYGSQPEDTRSLFYASWKKYQSQAVLEPLEKQIVDVILLHPEWHELLSDENPDFTIRYLPENGEINPFLHLGLHLGIRDQVALNKPQGMREIYQSLLKQEKDIHEVEHELMNCLAQAIWTMSQKQQHFNVDSYLQECRNLIKKQ